MRQTGVPGATGGPAGLPVLLLAALAHGGCGGGAEEPRDFAGGGETLWEVPPLPAPIGLEVDGRAVDPVVVEGYLTTLWAEHMTQSAAAGAPPSAESFLADPRALFTPLVRGMLLIHEAEERWPELPAEDLERLRAEMAVGAGGAYAALLDRIGEEAMRAHVARELRKRKLLEAFGAEAEPVTDEEVFRRYDEMMAGVDDPAPLLERGLNFQALEPRLRAELAREHAVRAQEAWIDARLPGAHVRAFLPGGREVAW